MRKTYTVEEMQISLHRVNHVAYINGKKISDKTYDRIRILQKFPQCRCCGAKATKWLFKPNNGWELLTDNGHRLTIDHIKPSIKGGKDNKNNYQNLCMKCNGTKSATEFKNVSILRFFIIHKLRLVRKSHVMRGIVNGIQ